MRKALLLLIMLMHTAVALAEKWSAETLPMVHLEDARKYVCNPDYVLSQAAVATTDSLLYLLEKDKGVQTVVVVVKHLEGDDPYQFGMALGKKYGIGSKAQRTGLIIVLATEDRSYQILTGNGLEGTLPDAITRRIQNREMVPQLKAGNWDAAIVNTVKSVDGYVRGDDTLTANDDADSTSDEVVGFVIVLAFVLFFIAVVVFTQRQYRCPNCKKAQMREVKRQRVHVAGTNSHCIQHIYRCPKCGHEKTFTEDDDNVSAGPMVPPVFFGGGGRSFGGGGSFGGSFGGGTFGGGGSGGRF